MRIQFSATNILQVQHRKDLKPLPFSSKAVKYHILDLLNRMVDERKDLGLRIDYIVGLYYSDPMVYRFTVSASFEERQGGKEDEMSQASTVLGDMVSHINRTIDSEKFQLDASAGPASLSEARELVIRKTT